MRDDAYPPPKKLYQGFGGRLYHGVPTWVRDDAIFHIRVRCKRGSTPLTEASLAATLLESARRNHERRRWWVHLFLLMPDHWYALLSFGRNASMSRIVGDWKKYHAWYNGVVWQEGYFDHRLRNHLAEFEAKQAYIRHNPVAKGLCATADAWPWQQAAIDIPTDTRPE